MGSETAPKLIGAANGGQSDGNIFIALGPFTSQTHREFTQNYCKFIANIRKNFWLPEGTKFHEPHLPHLTLKYLGDINSHKLLMPWIDEALGGIEIQPFDLFANGRVGVFPNRRRYSFWLGVEKNAWLTNLQENIVMKLHKMNPDKYPLTDHDILFKPHITFATVAPTLMTETEAVVQAAFLSGKTFDFTLRNDSFSILHNRPDPKRYDIVHAYDLVDEFDYDIDADGWESVKLGSL